MKTISYALMAAVLLAVFYWSAHCENTSDTVPVTRNTREYEPNSKTPPAPENRQFFADDFQSGALSEKKWATTRKNDFREASVSVVDAGEAGAHDYRLKMTADTIGTADDTVKLIGVRGLDPIDLSRAKDISFDLDWNNQSNGCYLSAAMYLCTTSTATTASDEPDWIKLEYIGVPPGRNARFQALCRTGNNIRLLYDEGWPRNGREGRRIGKVRVRIETDQSQLRIFENDIELFATSGHLFHPAVAYVYFEMSSHSNYPSRSITFDDITIADIHPDDRGTAGQ